MDAKEKLWFTHAAQAVNKCPWRQQFSGFSWHKQMPVQMTPVHLAQVYQKL
jgi:hypothetical protein